MCYMSALFAQDQLPESGVSFEQALSSFNGVLVVMFEEL